MTDHDEYVEGDVNQLDDAGGDEGGDDGAIAEAVLTHIAASLADEPGEVRVETEARGRRVTLRLSVAQQDMGRVIGRRGRTAQAIRTLVAAAGAREGISTSVDIVD